MKIINKFRKSLSLSQMNNLSHKTIIKILRNFQVLVKKVYLIAKVFMATNQSINLLKNMMNAMKKLRKKNKNKN